MSRIESWVDIPVWPCQKCGAVCDIEHRKAYTQEQVDTYVAEQERLYAMIRGGGVFYDPTPQIMAEGARHGEHLKLSCPRCQWHGTAPVRGPAALGWQR